MVLVTSDIRSSHSSDAEDNDLASQHTVRVKRTLPEDIIQKIGPDKDKGTFNTWFFVSVCPSKYRARGRLLSTREA